MAVSRFLLSLCIFFLSVTGFATSARSVAPVCEGLFDSAPTARPPVFHLYVASETLSQVVRDNAPDYWSWAKRNAAKYLTEKMLETEGLVPGDTHPGNFILGPIDGKIRFFLADLKDAGRAPFLLDFARLAMSTQAIYRRVEERPRFPFTLEHLFDSYIAGLKGHQQDPPDAVSHLFMLSMKQYQTEFEEPYVDRKTAYHRFRLKDGKIAPFTSEVTKLSASALQSAKASMIAEIRKLRPDAEVVDFAVRPRDRGGSKNADRWWALTTMGTRDEIVEFKEVGEPAVAQYEDQTELSERYTQVEDVYWGLHDPLIRAVRIDDRWFSMRPKKVEIYSIPYNPETDQRQDKLLDMATYVANYVGFKHGAQLNSRSYVKFLESHRDQVLKSVRALSKAYLDRVETRMESRP